MTSFMGPLWPHYGPIARHAKTSGNALLHKGLSGPRTTCFVMDKPKASAGFAGRGLSDVLQLALQLIALAKQRPHHLGAAEQ